MIHLRSESRNEKIRTTAAAPVNPPEPSWNLNAAHVRKALKFIKSKGAITATQLVEWDALHGRRLFTWNAEIGANLNRLSEARIFLNRFRAKFEGMRVRAFIHVREDDARGIDQAGYYTVQIISKHPGMREQIIADITSRLTGLMSELRMWKLSAEDRAALFTQLEKALEPDA